MAYRYVRRRAPPSPTPPWLRLTQVLNVLDPRQESVRPFAFLRRTFFTPSKGRLIRLPSSGLCLPLGDLCNGCATAAGSRLYGAPTLAGLQHRGNAGVARNVLSPTKTASRSKLLRRLQDAISKSPERSQPNCNFRAGRGSVRVDDFLRSNSQSPGSKNTKFEKQAIPQGRLVVFGDGRR